MLDSGPQLHKRPDHIFVTHTHGDHIANLPFTLIDSDLERDRVKVYAPKASEY